MIGKRRLGHPARISGRNVIKIEAAAIALATVLARKP